uniref:LIM zinc-binding domain-containing protein n=1 Tax=Tetraodon nigroviridis TaxID=99883 RepID=H3BXE8_TETNG
SPTQTFNDRVMSSSKGAEDKLYDTLIPSIIRTDCSPTDRAEDQLYDTLLPRSITSAANYSSYTDDSPTTRTTSYTISSSRPSFSLSSYSGVSSPTTTISTRLSRILQEKDLCTQCRKPFDGSAKMVLPEMKINCHATCFKCEVCNSTLGQMKAGDSLWIYRSMVHCENCFDITREKWRH